MRDSTVMSKDIPGTSGTWLSFRLFDPFLARVLIEHVLVKSQLVRLAVDRIQT